MTREQFDKISLCYDTSTQTYSNAQDVQWADLLNGFVIHNSGTNLLFFNNDPIPAGSSKSYGGNYGEVYKGRLSIRFQLALPPAGTINQVVITQKYYVF